jgi:metallo-beta-lactamase class B
MADNTTWRAACASYAAAVVCIAMPGVAPQAQDTAAEVAAHLETARQLAGNDVTAPFEFFCVPGNARANDFSAPPLEPVQIFDNVYAVGNAETWIYAITTSDGIILIVSGTAAEVEPIVLPGLAALGLDPADVRIILLGHGHSDHFGGSSFFQAEYGTRVGTTEADWNTMEQPAGRGRGVDPTAPRRDLVVSENEPVVLGDTSIRLVEIPGHTPGALGFIFSVYDNGARHVAGLFGGTVLATAYTPAAGLLQYVDSIERFLEVAAEEGVDVELQNHPIFDDTPQRLAALASRGAGEPHPFVIGREGYQRFWGIISVCMQADILNKG